MVQLPAGAGRCYSANCESERRSAGAIGDGGFVAGVDLCVYVLGELCELLGRGRGCGDAEPSVRARGA